MKRLFLGLSCLIAIFISNFATGYCEYTISEEDGLFCGNLGAAWEAAIRGRDGGIPPQEDWHFVLPYVKGNTEYGITEKMAKGIVNKAYFDPSLRGVHGSIGASIQIGCLENKRLDASSYKPLE